MQQRIGMLSLLILFVVFVRERSTAELSFSQARGICGGPVALTLNSTDPSAQIRFTVDGAAPDIENGKVYEAPIKIDRTTSVRAVEIVGESIGPVMTHTYVFPSRVWDQPMFPEGLVRSAPSSRRGIQDFDWGMDPELLDTMAKKEELEAALKSLPSLALTMAPGDFNYLFLNHTKRGVDYERAVSIELIYPDGSTYEGMKGFSIDCGVRMQGGQGVGQARKKAFRLLFKKEYGEGKLKYPVFESAPNQALSATDRFDGLVLRPGGNTNWSKDHAWKHEPSTYLRDSLVRDSQIAISGVGSHSTFVHLYINGLYNGIYNIAERPDSKFLASYFGGKPDGYYAINHSGTVDGHPSHWETMMSQVQQSSDLSVHSKYIDIDAFCDYIILNFIVGMGDWPWNNYYAGMRTSPDGTVGPARFYAWDGEYSFWTISGYLVSNPGAWVNPNFLRPGNRSRFSPIYRLWIALNRDPEFLVRFEDRVAKHCSEGGALSDKEMLVRFKRLTDTLEPAIVAEAARWGDAAIGQEDDPRTKKSNWAPNCEKIRTLIKGNTTKFLKALRQHDLYPNLDPPSLDQSTDEEVEPGTVITMKNPNRSGQIMLTLDGSDPRTLGGKIREGIRESKAGVPITIRNPTHLMARVYESGRWSSLFERRFFPKPLGQPLRITEIMPVPNEGEAVEFIKISNLSALDLDVSGYRIAGVDYRFAPGTIIGAKQFIHIIPNDDPEAFAKKYPEVNVHGTYRGHLSNDGEQLQIIDRNGMEVERVAFEAPDPGRSLTRNFVNGVPTPKLSH